MNQPTDKIPATDEKQLVFEFYNKIEVYSKATENQSIGQVGKIYAEYVSPNWFE